MGANTFFDKCSGKSAADAFQSARQQAQYDCGHGGYTGTIAEKTEFTLLPVPTGFSADEYANKLMDEDDPRISDKWGPAGCVEIGNGQYIFFGWASS